MKAGGTNAAPVKAGETNAAPVKASGTNAAPVKAGETNAAPINNAPIVGASTNSVVSLYVSRDGANTLIPISVARVNKLFSDIFHNKELAINVLFVNAKGEEELVPVTNVFLSLENKENERINGAQIFTISQTDGNLRKVSAWANLENIWQVYRIETRDQHGVETTYELTRPAAATPAAPTSVPAGTNSVPAGTNSVPAGTNSAPAAAVGPVLTSPIAPSWLAAVIKDVNDFVAANPKVSPKDVNDLGKKIGWYIVQISAPGAKANEKDLMGTRNEIEAMIAKLKNVGGIDFDSKYLQMNMQGDGMNVPVPKGFEWLLTTPIRGFFPRILDIRSGTGLELAFFRGLITPEQERSARAHLPKPMAVDHQFAMKEWASEEQVHVV